MLSVLILTYNEELNVEDCIRSLPWTGDVWVLDSGSTDGTATIAERCGAKVVERPFSGYASQRNYGLSLPFGNDWIVMLDADERMTPELAAEIERRVREAADDIAMFRVRRKDLVVGKWLKRSSGYPTWFPRVFRKGRVCVKREINEVYASDGRAIQLNEHIEHLPMSKGIEWWFDRHNRYSSEEARLLLKTSGKLEHEGWQAERLTDPARRRQLMKTILYHLPFRPALVFLYLYVVRLGFLDGKAGFAFCRMRLAYELMIDVKVAFWRSSLGVQSTDKGD